MRNKIWIVLILLLVMFNLISAADHFIENRDDVVPAYRWTAGCTPTAASMLVGYYDWYSPTGKYTFFGKLVNYYFEREVIKKYTDHNGNHYRWSGGHYYDPIPYAVYPLAWEMKTDAITGKTVSFPGDERIQNGINYWTDICSGYAFWTDEQAVFFNWAHIFHVIQDEIDAWRPCVWSRDGTWHNGYVGGHSVAVIGYNDAGYVYYRSTWDLGWHAYHYSGGAGMHYSNCAVAVPGGECYSGDIELLSPDGGEVWAGGSVHDIEWYQWPDYWSGVNKIALVRIYCSSDSGYSWDNVDVVSTGSAGFNSYAWTVPNIENEHVFIKVEARASLGELVTIAFEGSESRFEIYPRSLTVTSPNGNEIWQGGNTYNITWTSSNVEPSENIAIALYKGGFYNSTITNGTTNNGVYSWQIPSNVDAGDDYKIHISIANAPSIYDYSNNNFTIRWVLAPSNLTVTSYPPWNSANLEWQDNSSNEAGFKIAKATNGDWNEDYATVGPNVTQYTDNDIAFLYTYNYKVRAFDGLGHPSNWSNVVEFSSGILAQSDYPEMSAFNNQKKVVYGDDGKIHLAYYNGSSMYYTSSADQGVTFDPWYYLYVMNPVDTTPSLAFGYGNNPVVAYGSNEQVGGSSPPHRFRYYVLLISDPLPYPDIYYNSDPTTQDKRPTPPSLVFKSVSDSGYVAFRHYDGSIKVAGPYGSGAQTIASYGYLPSIGYDEDDSGEGGRIIVVVYDGACGVTLYYRDVNSATWDSVSLPDFYAYGSPSLCIGTNELRIACEGWNDISQTEGIFSIRFVWSYIENDYIPQPIELVSSYFDYDPYLIEGYSYVPSMNVVMWKYDDDIWYSQQSGLYSWSRRRNISNTAGQSSCYPQGVVYDAGMYDKLFALWTEKIDNDYYLVRKTITLRNVPSQITDGIQETGIKYTGPFAFKKVYPNPAKGILKIRFSSPDERSVTVKLYDVTGRLIERIFDGKAKIGLNEITYTSRNISSGIYFVRLETEKKNITEKVLFQR